MKILIVEKGENPTTETYLTALMRHKGLEYKRVTHEDLTDEDADVLIVVRYLSSRLIKVIEKIKPKRVFYFMDDDLLDWHSLRALPMKYAVKLLLNATIYKSWIEKNATLVVSNTRLQSKYSEMKPILLPPNPTWMDGANLRLNVKNTPFVVFYHATSSHKEEFIWLSELIKKMKDREVFFEVVTDEKNVKHFKKLNNTWTIRPMRWNNYRNFLSLKYRSLALAINFPNQFNRMRTYVKFFNNLYAGVVGIYNTDFPESNIINQAKAGVVLPLDHKLWIEAILEIKNSREYVEEIFMNASSLYEYFKTQAKASYDKIDFT